MTIPYFHILRREALYTWKKRNGSSATYSKLLKIFERAGCKNYTDEVRRIVQLSDNETDDSSGSGEEQSQVEQPQTFPIQKSQALSQVPPATSEPTVVYAMVEEENLPEGKSSTNTRVASPLLLGVLLWVSHI